MPRRLFMGLVLAFVISPVALAYERDSHYYLRYGLSLATCFEWDEAHLIASGDWGMDENRSTHAEMNPIQTKQKIAWHAFGHSDGRFHELWERTRAEEDLEHRLVKLGQFMHFLEDWESHAGYGVRMGHARATFSGNDPDSLGSDPLRNRRMVQSALDHLLQTCADLGRLDEDVDDILARMMKTLDEDRLLDQLFDNSDPSWKKGKLGGLRKEAHEIMAANKTRVEELIEKYIAPLPHKNVPPDFLPGDPERGLPPSLGLTFDGSGLVLDVPDTVEEVTAAWAAAAHHAPDISVSVTRGRARKKRWVVTLEIHNEGEEAQSEVPVEVVVVDSAEETVLAKVEQTAAALGPGETRELQIELPALDRATKDVIYGAYVRVATDDDWVDNVDWLMSEKVAESSPEVAIVDDIDEPESDDQRLQGPLEIVGFVDDPKVILIGDHACLVLRAYAAGGDSTEKLGEVQIGLELDDGEPLKLLRNIPPIWSASTTERNLVAGKLVACFKPGPEQCATWYSVENPHVVVAIAMRDPGVAPVRETLALNEESHERAKRVCNQFGIFGMGPGKQAATAAGR